MARKSIGQRLDALLDGAVARPAAIGAALVCVGLVLGALLAPPPTAWGEERMAAPPPAFKSGDQISVPILQEIAGTLNRIDGRLARLEVVFQELSTPQPRTTTSN